MSQQYLHRGNLLWESSRMFLPEHKEALLERRLDLQKVGKPELDEQELEEIGIIVTDSLKHELDVQIIYWEDGLFHELIGIVDRIDWQCKKIKIRTEDMPTYIDIDCLKSVIRA
ncbi:YolD-like family protein [Halalkalibacter okhensis]|uniref:YolD-like family protein n=1 Tax=Halalkalibacter okhensis TaxID=333138 RepID=UPI0006893A95|nr:YolD-like family protein [Halalkalibacter okhensis]